MAPGELVNGDKYKHNRSLEDVTAISPLSSTQAGMPKVNGTVPAQSARQEETHAAKLSSLVDHLSRRYSNPALQVDTTHRISMSDTAIPCPAPTEALIHVRCSGICGSDLHLWHRGRIGTLTINGPCILGHEAAGQVLAVGAKVTKVKPGDRVAIEPGVPCHECWLCRSGRYNLCERVGFCGVGTPGCGGSIRRFMCHDAKYCHVMPASMSWSQGALLEPLSVVMHAVSECRGAVALGRPVLICGAGPIGLIALKAAQASGAWPLVITDVNAGRLEFAETLVPGVRTWRVDAAMNEVQTADAVRSLFGCKGDRDVEHGVPDEQEYVAPGVVLECTGIEGSVVTAAYACRRGGTVMVIGVGRDKMNNLPFMHMSLAEIQLKFINRYRDTWPAAINLLADRRVLDLDALVTHLFELERSVEAMETCADPSLGSVKIHIVDNTQVEIDV